MEPAKDQADYEPPELTDPLTLLIKLRFIPYTELGLSAELIECLRQHLERGLDAVLPVHDGLGAAWQLAASLTGLTGGQIRLLLEGLNHLIRSTNLSRKIDPGRLSARARAAHRPLQPQARLGPHQSDRAGRPVSRGSWLRSRIHHHPGSRSIRATTSSSFTPGDQGRLLPAEGHNACDAPRSLARAGRAGLRRATAILVPTRIRPRTNAQGRLSCVPATCCYWKRY